MTTANPPVLPITPLTSVGESGDAVSKAEGERAVAVERSVADQVTRTTIPESLVDTIAIVEKFGGDEAPTSGLGNETSIEKPRDITPALLEASSDMSISSGMSPIPRPSNSPPRMHKSHPNAMEPKCLKCGNREKPLKPLVQCVDCKLYHHTCCHNPVITVKHGQP